MVDSSNPPRTSTARWLAIGGALITGSAGIIMAVYSVMAGESTGGGALLAASALAFGLLAAYVDRFPARPPNETTSETAMVDGHVPEPAVNAQPVSEQIDAEPITARELEVLSLVAEGYSNKLISAELGISERTVKNHLTLTMGKLRASDRTHAVVTTVRLGWLDINHKSATAGARAQGRPVGDRS